MREENDKPLLKIYYYCCNARLWQTFFAVKLTWSGAHQLFEPFHQAHSYCYLQAFEVRKTCFKLWEVQDYIT